MRNKCVPLSSLRSAFTCVEFENLGSPINISLAHKNVQMQRLQFRIVPWCLKLVFVSILVFAADETSAQRKATEYRLKVELMDGTSNKGLLKSINDTSISIQVRGNENTVHDFSAGQIRSIAWRRKSSFGRGAALGALSGLVLGTAVGYATYSRPDCDPGGLCVDFGPELNAMAGAISGAFIGSVTGSLAGLINKKSPVDGDAIKYAKFKYLIMQKMQGHKTAITDKRAPRLEKKI